MGRKNSEKRGEKDADGNTDRSLFARLVEAVIVFFLCCGLIKLGVTYLTSVKIPLIIIAVIVGIVIIGWRVCKWRDRNDY